ncbi:MAG: hypothetical protein NTZ05_10980 [Chloroflexi bacterium]|nr:hypothetical protein [Chloroflexota bacterium]
MSAEEVLAVVARIVREPGYRSGLRSGDASLLDDYYLDEDERAALLAPEGTALDEFIPAAPPVYLMPRKEDPTASMTFEFTAPAPRRKSTAGGGAVPAQPAADPWNVLVARLLQNLLQVITLEKDGVEVAFDGFRLRPTAHPVEQVVETKKPARLPLPRLRGGPSFDYQPLQSIRQSAPLVETMYTGITSLLSLVELTYEGQPVVVDAFQLRRLDDWVLPGDNPDAVLRYLSSACQIACEFCYQLGNPPPLRNIKKRTAESEITTRLRRFEAGEELFYQNVFDSDEVLNHPRAIEFLRRVRQHSKRRYTQGTGRGAAGGPRDFAQRA